MKLFLMRKLILVSVVFFSSSVLAYLDGRLYIPNPAPYPIGCSTFVVTEPGNFHFHANGEVLFSETVPLWDINQVAMLDVEVRILRMGCTEPDRSIILLQLSVPHTDDGIESWVPIPLVFGEIDERVYPLRLARESNTHWMINEILEEGNTTGYYLDNWLGWEWSLEFANELHSEYFSMMQPSQYNDEFKLHVIDRATWKGQVDGPSFLIPAYANQLNEDHLLWHGMLSGIWVTPQVPDQGFLISISETDWNTAPGSLHIFFTWNTFNHQGEPLWLAGNSSLKPHLESVAVDLILLEQGQFLGSKNAARKLVGSLRLQPKSCTEILAEFDLESLGLGKGSFVLTRLQNLETAGLACQDFERQRNFN
jgi:hypothetical protein